MTGREAGFLLLTCPMGDPDRKVLTPAQLRTLGKRVRQMETPDGDRDLQAEDLLSLGYGPEAAEHIVSLLQQENLAEHYCRKALQANCWPLTQLSGQYPRRVFDRLGLEGPGSIWCRGELSLLGKQAVSLVGSRELEPDNRAFAEAVGRQAAAQGFVLISGNARGADQAAQNACLEAGGSVISVVADTLADKPLKERVLYISEDGYDLPFSAQRALSRNRLIHAMGEKTFVAQCGYQTGGTWNGTVRNLRFGWSPVYVYADGSPAQILLQDMGAEAVTLSELSDFSLLQKAEVSFLE